MINNKKQGDISVRGPLARSADDLKLIMEVIAPDPDLPRADARGIADYRVGLVSSLPVCPTSAETRAAVHGVAEKLRAAGAHVELDVELPFDPTEMMRVYLKVRSPSTSVSCTSHSPFLTFHF